ncbi:hypothetical protein LC593_31875 [Nostoc sp. CHAB 5844]|nr:hypothetical protein [Nostoc sp. CHAB 5844]
MIYATGSKQEKHQAYLEWLTAKIQQLENQKSALHKELLELRTKLRENEDYEPS